MANTTVPVLNRSLFEFYMYWKALKMLGIPSLLASLAGGLGAVGTGLTMASSAAGARGALMSMGGLGGRIAASGAGLMAARIGAGLAVGATGAGALYLGYKGLEFINDKGYADIPGFATGGYMNRANGGPVMVGEQGPELFMPGQAGQVLNNAETNNILGNDVIMRNVTIGIDSFGGIV
jgi:hypothetical protein